MQANTTSVNTHPNLSLSDVDRIVKRLGSRKQARVRCGRVRSTDGAGFGRLPAGNAVGKGRTAFVGAWSSILLDCDANSALSNKSNLV